jgi:hypothetical protein
MDARSDRRAPAVHRVPLDVLVRLSHEDWQEPFDADGVDVSAGGLALRSDYLPEIGDRLRCRFDCPPSGDEVEIDGEVVWAHDAGERSGEFGMRFTDVGEAQNALHSLISHVGGAPIARASTTVRLHLDRVATPIEAEVIERSDGWLTVEQELPFLKLGMGVAVEGLGPARGRLASVDLRLEGGVPRLLLVVEHDGVRDSAPSPVDQTSDETLQDVDAAALVREAAPIEAAPEDELDAEDEAAPQAEAHESSRDAMAPPATHDEPRAVWQDLLDKAKERAAAIAVLAIDRGKPALASVLAKLVAFAGMVMAKGGPRMKRLGARASALVGSLGAKIKERTKGKRRTAAVPVRVAAPPKRRPQREEVEAPAPKRMRRIVMLSVIAFLGVGAAVYVFASDHGGEPEPEPARAAAPPPAPVIAPPPVQLAAPVDAPIEPAVDAPLPDPRAMPEPESAAGQLGEPSYPSLRDATQRQTAPAVEGQSFGAASVPNGRSAMIRMSQPVASLTGQQESDGFTVTIQGALALDRAGPIASANPSVERAMILNRGDHSVLTVRFVAGRNPPYRVVARDRAIEIVIGR